MVVKQQSPNQSAEGDTISTWSAMNNESSNNSNKTFSNEDSQPDSEFMKKFLVYYPNGTSEIVESIHQPPKNQDDPFILPQNLIVCMN